MPLGGSENIAYGIGQPTDELSRFGAEQVASAFELKAAEVIADAPVIATWNGESSALYHWLETRHGWHTNEAFHYVNWVRLKIWPTAGSLAG